MSDSAFQLLRNALAAVDTKQRVLWVADENISVADIASMNPSAAIQVMTNRCDLANKFKAQGFDVLLNDYDFSSVSLNSLDGIFYRVSKEKPVVHHIINAAGCCLKESGNLFLSGYKNEGIKTYVSKAASYLGGAVDKQRSAKSSLLARLEFCGEVAEPLDDKDYRQEQVISDADLSEQGIHFLSKPGVYGWNKVDRGSAFLIEHLTGVLQQLTIAPKLVIDLGCGYGYLSVMTKQYLATEFLATDNNVASVALCQKNFLANGVSGQAILTDCGDGIVEKADFILCNPPFHQGFDIDGDLTLKFLCAAKDLLSVGGSALFVVNSFIPLEKKAAEFFSQVNQVANNGSFKVVLLAA